MPPHGRPWPSPPWTTPSAGDRRRQPMPSSTTRSPEHRPRRRDPRAGAVRYAGARPSGPGEAPVRKGDMTSAPPDDASHTAPGTTRPALDADLDARLAFLLEADRLK